MVWEFPSRVNLIHESYRREYRLLTEAFREASISSVTGAIKTTLGSDWNHRFRNSEGIVDFLVNMKLLVLFVFLATALCSMLSVQASLLQGNDALYPMQGPPPPGGAGGKPGGEKKKGPQ